MHAVGTCVHGARHSTTGIQVTQITWPRSSQAKHFENSVFAFGRSKRPRVGVGDGFREKVALEQGQEGSQGWDKERGYLEKCTWPSLRRGGKIDRHRGWHRIDAQNIY